MAVYRVRVNFKNVVFYGDRHLPGTVDSTDHFSYETDNTKAAIVKALMEEGCGVWIAHERVWVPNNMFSSVEFLLREGK